MSFSCIKFSKLISERRDRELSPSELQYLEFHKAVCLKCNQAVTNSDNAFSFLKMADLNAQPSERFNEELLVRLKENRLSALVGYWSPALVGALVAGVVAIFAVNLFAKTATTPNFKRPYGEARRVNQDSDPFNSLFNNVSVPR